MLLHACTVRVLLRYSGVFRGCLASVVTRDKRSQAATVPDAFVRVVAPPRIKRIMSRVAHKQDKQEIP